MCGFDGIQKGNYFGGKPTGREREMKDLLSICEITNLQVWSQRKKRVHEGRAFHSWKRLPTKDDSGWKEHVDCEVINQCMERYIKRKHRNNVVGQSRLDPKKRVLVRLVVSKEDRKRAS